MVSGPIPAAQVQGMPPAPSTPPAPVQAPQPPAPPAPSYTPAGGSASTQSMALRQSNGTDRVQISTQAMNASQGNVSSAPKNVSSSTINQPNTPPNPPIRTAMSGGPQTAPQQPVGAAYAKNQPGNAPQSPGQGVQQSGQFLNLMG